MTAEDIAKMSKEFPLKDFLVWGIPVPYSEDERDSRLEDINLLHEEHIDPLYRVAQADGLEIKDIEVI